MSRKIFVNLPVGSLDRSVEFFRSLGFAFNADYTDDTSACMVVSDDIFAMLLTHEKFAKFTPKPISDAHRSTEVLIAVSVDTKAEVDALLAKALAGGAREAREPQDHGFMFARSFEDLDGHIWEIVWIEALAGKPGDRAAA